MRTRTKLSLTVVVIVLLSTFLAIELRRTYWSARRLAAEEAKRFDDCTYAGTRLSWSEIYSPPKYVSLPHWEVSYESTNPVHRFTRIITMSEARAKANQALDRD
jgi:hypothetical protein